MLSANGPFADDFHALHSLFDLSHHGSNSCFDPMAFQLLPAGKWRELEPVGGCELLVGVGLTALMGSALFRAVDPDAFQNLASREGARGGRSRPVPRRCDETLLATLLEEIP
jgi:hypothetical protein